MRGEANWQAGGEDERLRTEGGRNNAKVPRSAPEKGRAPLGKGVLIALLPNDTTHSEKEHVEH